MQVTSLQAQATEHRMIKEKLQAAVAAALGDAVTEACPLPLASQQQTPGSNVASIGSTSADDLQNAISSLKVCCMSDLTIYGQLLSHTYTLLMTAFQCGND